MFRSLTLPAAMLSVLALSACDLAYPVAVIGEDGTVFRGFATDTVLQGGRFQAMNGNLVCSGTYSRAVDVSDVSFPVRCSNGLTGLGKARFESATTGAGTVYMSDGSNGSSSLVSAPPAFDLAALRRGLLLDTKEERAEKKRDRDG